MDILNSLSLDIWIVVKAMFIVGMVIYILFALIVVRQVSHMTKTLQVGFELPLRIGAWIHFFAAVGLLVFAILYL